MSTTLKTRPHLPPEIAVEPTASLLNPELSFPKGIYNSEQHALELGSKIGVGGEGTVYNIQGQADLVAKIYHEPPSAEKAEKLIALARLGSERLYKMSAWPVDVLRDRPGGNVIGFVMKKIGQAEEVHTLHSPKSRLKKFPDASWAFLLHVATNIARAVATMHEHGFVVGDVNPKNILVTRQATVYLLDCDSFQFSAAGKTYRCEGGFPEYTPPELQGIPFSEVDRNQEHDCFGLAVVIFQLLFLGRHPYSGRFLGADEMPLEKAIREFRFAYGTDAAERQMQPPPGTLSLEAIPPSIIELLRRAFLEVDRPNSHEWIEPLTQLAKSLRRCVLHSGHSYYDALVECPWCQIETRARIRLFNFNLVEARQNREAFRLDEIWAEVEKLQLFEMLGQPVTESPQLSPEVIAYVKHRRMRFWIATVFAALGGVFSAMVGGICAAFWLVPIFRMFAIWIAGARKQRDDGMQPLLSAQSYVPNNALAQKIFQLQKNTEDNIRELEQKLGGTKEKEAFLAKVNELKTKLEMYENLQQHAPKSKKSAKAKSRLQTEEATDRRRFQLEHEITINAYYLRHLRQQLDAKQQQILPALRQAQQTLAQADKELIVVNENNHSAPITLVIILAFLLTLIINSIWSVPVYISDDRNYGSNVQPVPPPANVSVPSDNILPSPGFSNYYKEGKRKFKEGDWLEAKNSFLDASTFISVSGWSQDYASLYYDLGRARVKLGEAERRIEYSEYYVRDNPENELYRFQLIILYSLVGRKQDAEREFQILKGSSPILAQSLEQVMREHGVYLTGHSH